MNFDIIKIWEIPGVYNIIWNFQSCFTYLNKTVKTQCFFHFYKKTCLRPKNFFSLIVRSLPGDLNILALFSFHQFEGLPVKTDNGVRKPITSMQVPRCSYLFITFYGKENRRYGALFFKMWSFTKLSWDSDYLWIYHITSRLKLKIFCAFSMGYWVSN